MKQHPFCVGSEFVVLVYAKRYRDENDEATFALIFTKYLYMKS